MYGGHACDLERAPTVRSLNLYLVAFFLAYQSGTDRRKGRKEAFFRIAFFRSNKLVGDLFFFFEVEQDNGRAVGDAVMRQLRDIDRFQFAKPLCHLHQTGFHDGLPLERGLVLGIFAQIAEFAGLLDLSGHGLDIRACFRQRNSDNSSGLQSYHFPGVTIVKRPHGARAKIRTQHTVERVGATASLKVSKHGASRLLSRHRLDDLSNVIAHSAKTKFVRVGIHFALPYFHRSFGNNNIRESGAAVLTFLYRSYYGVERERYLRYQNNIGAPCKARVKGDPACMAAHNFQDHHAVVRCCGRMKAVKCFGRHIDRGHKTERQFRGGKIVIDRLWNTDDRKTTIVKLFGDRESPFTADRDQRFDAQYIEVRQRLADGQLGNLRLAVDHFDKTAFVSRPQNCATARQNAAHRRTCELHRMRFAENAFEAVLDADALHPKLADRRPYNSTNYRVQAWGIAAAGQYSDLFIHLKPI